MSEIFTFSNIIFIINGISKTMFIVSFSLLPSLIFGTILALMRHSDNKFFKVISSIFIDIVRNIPNLLWIYIVFLIFKLSSNMTGIVSFSLFSSAAFAEIIRGGLNSLDIGQFEAAYSQGLNYFQSLFYIILPQAFQRCLMTLSLQVVTIVKDTSLLWSVAGIQELTGNVTILMNKHQSITQIFILYGILTILYFVINFTILNFFKYIQD